MRLTTRLARRLRLLLFRNAVEREMAREMESHLEYETRAREQAGTPAAEARRLAERAFGHRSTLAEAARDARGGRAADEAASDLRFALRQLRRSPGHAGAAIGILATAIAGVALALALVRAYLLRPFPYPEPARLMQVLFGPDREFRPNGPDLRGVDWVPAAALFEATASWDLDGFTLVQPDLPSEYVNGAWVSAGYFRLLGLDPALGRGFAADEYVTGSNVALISDGLWRRRFGADPDVLGRSVRIHSTDRPDEDALITIVGVLPPAEWHLNRFTEILRPLGAPRNFYLARLAPGMTREEAQRRLTDVVRSQVDIPDQTWHLTLVPAQDEYTFAIRPALGILLAATALLLLLAEASVGALLVARGTARLPELAMRRVLGATPGRLVRQAAVEAFLVGGLALAGGTLLAILLGPLAGRALETFGGVAVPGGSSTVTVDLPTLAAVVGVTLLPYLVMAVLPVVGLARGQGPSSFGSTRVSGGIRLARTRRALVATQVAVAVALLAQGALFIQSARTMHRTDLGFTPEAVLQGYLLLPRNTYPDPAARRLVMERLLERIEGIPGVLGAGAIMPPPFRGNPFTAVECEGCATSGESVLAVPQTVTPGYFPTMGISLVSGRWFEPGDDSTSAQAAIVSEDLARRFWGPEDPLGRRVRRVTPDGDAPWLTVVGVVRDVRKTYSDTLHPDLYRPFSQDPRAYFALMVGVTGPPLSLARPVQEAVSALDPGLALADVEPLGAVIAARRSQTGMLATFVGGIGLLAFGLAVAGLYAVVAYLVRLRRREFAVRVALGAPVRQVVSAVLAESRGMIAIGVVGGVSLALAGGRMSKAWLMGVAPGDPATLAAVVAAVVAVVGLALLVPARRAAGADPGSVLREE